MATRLTHYVRESRDELKKVVWPTRKETARNTLFVIIISLVVAAILGLADFGLTFIVDTFLLN